MNERYGVNRPEKDNTVKIENLKGIFFTLTFIISTYGLDLFQSIF